MIVFLLQFESMNQLCVRMDSRVSLDIEISHRFLPHTTFFLSLGSADESRSLRRRLVNSCLVIRREINDPDCSSFFDANQELRVFYVT